MHGLFFYMGAFRHVVNDPSRVVKGSIRPCNINVRGVFGGAGKAPKYMCDAIDVVTTHNGTAELLMQDTIMIETCPRTRLLQVVVWHGVVSLQPLRRAINRVLWFHRAAMSYIWRIEAFCCSVCWTRGSGGRGVCWKRMSSFSGGHSDSKVLVYACYVCSFLASMGG